MELHPDKNDAADAQEMFQRLGAAYDVLKDDEERARYNKRLDYFRRTGRDRFFDFADAYERKYGPPPIAFWRMIGFGTVILSGLQWVFRRYRYNHYQALARTTPRYKEALRKAAMEKEIAAGTAGDRQNKKKKKRRKPVTSQATTDGDGGGGDDGDDNGNDGDGDEIDIVVGGAEYPHWTDLLFYKIFCLPLTAVKWGVYQVRHSILGEPRILSEEIHPGHFEMLMGRLSRASEEKQAQYLKHLWKGNYRLTPDELEEWEIKATPPAEAKADDDDDKAADDDPKEDGDAEADDAE